MLRNENRSENADDLVDLFDSSSGMRFYEKIQLAIGILYRQNYYMNFQLLRFPPMKLGIT